MGTQFLQSLTGTQGKATLKHIKALGGSIFKRAVIERRTRLSVSVHRGSADPRSLEVEIIDVACDRCEGIDAAAVGIRGQVSAQPGSRGRRWPHGRVAGCVVE